MVTVARVHGAARQPARTADVSPLQTIREDGAMKRAGSIAVLGALSLLAACGTEPQERTTGGAAAGAATGAAVGALAGPPGVAVGALVGGGAGAITGAATKPSTVNLGKPPWTNPQTRVPTPNGPVGPATRTRYQSDTSQNSQVDQLNEQSLESARSGQNYR
jgi:phage tail tape-measure protein